jgi:hypothetical protein
MNVSSSTNSSQVETPKDPIKKAIEVQEQQVLKILDGANEQAQKVASQKTGLGNNLNIAG